MRAAESVAPRRALQVAPIIVTSLARHGRFVRYMLLLAWILTRLGAIAQRNGVDAWGPEVPR